MLRKVTTTGDRNNYCHDDMRWRFSITPKRRASCFYSMPESNNSGFKNMYGSSWYHADCTGSNNDCTSG